MNAPLAMKMTVVTMVTTMAVTHVTASQPEVKVGNTTVLGAAVQVGNTTVNYFLGLRFGHPVQGSSPNAQRFRKYRLASLPGGTVNATEFPRSCPGPWSLLPMDEDCLFINIHAPQPGGQSNGRKPVMVWIYGGSFVVGSGAEYDGGRLAAEGDVIVVTFNYRLGPIGFLSTGDNSSVGNFGLWDQWLALTWVRQHIGEFGGDVNRVTLFGESAGAASVSFHMTSPRSRDLFHRAILFSGTRQNPWALVSDPLKHARDFARNKSCPDVDSTSAVVECLRGKAWQDMVPPWSLDNEAWVPVVDMDLVFPLDPSQPFAGQMMIGVNNREGGMLVSSKATRWDVHDREAHLDYVRRVLPTLFPELAAAASPQQLALTARVVDCVYRGSGSTDSHVTDKELEDFVGDIEINLGSQQFLDGGFATGDLYHYYFDHFPDNIKGGEKGMDHAADLDYTFGIDWGLRRFYSNFFNVTASERDLLLARRFRTLLTNFAHSGNPNQPIQIPAWPKWPTYTKGNQSYYSLTFQPRVGSRLKEERMSVWGRTVPALLRSQGPVGLDGTSRAQCSLLATSRGPVVAAAYPAVVAVVLPLLALVAARVWE